METFIIKRLLRRGERGAKPLWMSSVPTTSSLLCPEPGCSAPATQNPASPCPAEQGAGTAVCKINK